MVVEVVHGSCMELVRSTAAAEPRESMVSDLVSEQAFVHVVARKPNKISWENLHCCISS